MHHNLKYRERQLKYVCEKKEKKKILIAQHFHEDIKALIKKFSRHSLITCCNIYIIDYSYLINAKFDFMFFFICTSHLVFVSFVRFVLFLYSAFVYSFFYSFLCFVLFSFFFFCFYFIFMRNIVDVQS